MAPRATLDRKSQIVSAAIERLIAVGFEGFRLGDVAKDVGINNATLIHHYPSKVALIRAVVEQFTRKFEAVADATDADGAPPEKLAWHMRSSFELMRTSPGMFVVLNEIMIRARRDSEIARLVSAPLAAWRGHIVSLLLSPAAEGDAVARRGAEEVATACMSQLLGIGLLMNSTDLELSSLERLREGTESRAVTALTHLAETGL